MLQGRFDAGEALDLIERHGCVSIYTLPGVEMRIVHEDTGTVRGSDEPGLVETRGPYVMHGYIAASIVHNAATFTKDGWFQSGDIGQLTPAGEFVLLGRSTELALARATTGKDPKRLGIVMDNTASPVNFTRGLRAGAAEKLGMQIVVDETFPRRCPTPAR